ncbi:MAG: PDZ domain-containing protein [Alloprevotella sp.]
MKRILIILMTLLPLAVSSQTLGEALKGLFGKSINEIAGSAAKNNGQTNLQRNEHYTLSLGYLRHFNPGKLTVKNNYGWLHFDHLKSNAPSAGLVLASYDEVLSINGVPASDFKDAREAMEAASTPGDNGRVEIEFYSMSEDSVFWASFEPANIVTVGQDESDLTVDGVATFSQIRFEYGSSPSCEILYDKAVEDWSKYRRIAFQPLSDDPLKEKSFADIVKRNLIYSGFPFIFVDLEDNPDLILTLAFDENSQVQRTYVPPTTQYVETGSRTMVTSYKNNLYINSFKKPQRRVTTGGFTHREYDVNHFLEVTIMDARKMLDSTQRTPPIIWQLRYQKRFERPYSLKDAAYKVFKGCTAFPGGTPVFDPVLCWNGICWDPQKPIITYIYSSSPAEKMGLQVGDEIISIDGKKSIKFMRQARQNGRTHMNPSIQHTLTFKNGWYNMVNDKRISPFADLDFDLPFVAVYGQLENQYYDDIKRWYEPNVFTPNSEHVVEIKRNGKKMKLTGVLYKKIYFFDATQNTP